MKTDDFDYELPKELIAQTPLKNRSESKLLVMDRVTGALEHKHFYDIIDYLNKVEIKLKANGDEEAMSIDNEYIKAMEFGMPPISGWGLGIDRFLQFLTNSDNIRDVVLYPLMKPRTSVEDEE